MQAGSGLAIASAMAWLAAWASASTAWAAVEASITGSVETAYNSTVTDTGGDMAVTARPGLILSFIRPRSRTDLHYEFGYQAFIRNPDVNNYQNRLSLSVTAQASPTTTFDFQESFLQANAINFSAEAEPLDPGGGLAYTDAAFLFNRNRIGLDKELSPQWGLRIFTGLEYYQPLSEPEEDSTSAGYSFDIALGTDVVREFSRDALALHAQVDYTLLQRQDDGVLLEGTLRWTRMLTTWLEARAELGGAWFAFAGNPRHGTVGPVYGARLRIREDELHCEANYSHGFGVNLQSSSESKDDSLSAEGRYAITDRFWVFAGGGYMWRKMLTAVEIDDMEVTEVQTAYATAGLVYRFRESWQVEGRYYFRRQRGAAADFDRHVGMITLGVIWPRRDTGFF